MQWKDCRGGTCKAGLNAVAHAFHVLRLFVSIQRLCLELEPAKRSRLLSETKFTPSEELVLPHDHIESSGVIIDLGRTQVLVWVPLTLSVLYV